jgi:phosphoserine phosphatase RsbU/P
VDAGDPYAVAVLDVQMPGMDGISLCRRLRERDKHEPLYIILLTARQHSADIVQGLEAGADDYIAKPFDNMELQARLNVGKRMISLQKQMQERERLQGVLEMAGAVCHEINQPLQIAAGLSEILLLDVSAEDSSYAPLKKIQTQVHRIGRLTRKIMQITKYQSKSYLKGHIVDIDKASG